MNLVPAATLLGALKDKLGAIKISDDPDADALFEVIEIYGNKHLGKALADLIITKGRVCLLVPTGTRRIHEDGGGSVVSRRYLEVDLLMADRAYYQAAQVAVAGGDKNIGTLEMSERVELALIGADLSPYGPAIFDSGAPQEITSQVMKNQPGRETWIQTLLVPAGIIITPTV